EIEAPLLANMTEFGKSPLLSFQELSDFGYRMVIFPMSAFRVSMKASDEFLRDLKRRETQSGWLDQMQTRKELYELLDYEPTAESWQERESVRSLNRLNVSDARVRENRPMSKETKPDYSPGLAGVIAGETAVCWVDPNAGLM